MREQVDTEDHLGTAAPVSVEIFKIASSYLGSIILQHELLTHAICGLSRDTFLFFWRIHFLRP